MSLLLACALVLFSCSTKTPAPEDEYRIEQVRFERSGSWGIRYGYTVVFRKDGAASYWGDTQAKPPGERRGEITAEQFQRLAELIKDSGFFSLGDQPRTCVDAEVRTTTVVYAGGSKTVKNYCQAMHTELEALEQEFITLVEQIAWKRGDG
jgi:hypothetical protein